MADSGSQRMIYKKILKVGSKHKLRTKTEKRKNQIDKECEREIYREKDRERQRDRERHKKRHRQTASESQRILSVSQKEI